MTKKTVQANRQVDRLDPLLRDALAIVLRLRSGKAVFADAERLTAWRTQSPAHERAFRDAVRCWNALRPAILASEAQHAPNPHQSTRICGG